MIFKETGGELRKEVQKDKILYQGFRQFSVLADDTDTTGTVLAAATIAIGSNHPGEPLAKCRGVAARYVQNAGLGTVKTFELRCDYSSDFDPDAVKENPLERPAQWQCTFNRVSKTILKSIDSVPKLIQNKAGVRSPQDIEESHCVIRITKNYAVETSWPYVMSFQDTLNDYEWEGVPEGCGRMGVELSGPHKENDVDFVTIIFTIELRREIEEYVTGEGTTMHGGWELEVVNEGTMEKVTEGATTYLRPILSQYGHPITEPQLLNTDGSKASPGAEPNYIYYNVYYKTDWTGIPE